MLPNWYTKLRKSDMEMDNYVSLSFNINSFKFDTAFYITELLFIEYKKQFHPLLKFF